jgi:NAD(P)-dependent dehydrogenase (short-subunit alcohol dehydrogenase family)
MDVDHKIAIITGAGSGIGRATAIEFARHGCTVVLADIKEDRLAEALDEVCRYASASTAEVCDVSDEAQVKRMVQAVHERYGAIDILINNAGIQIVRSWENLSSSEFDEQMAINFYGAVYCIRAVVPIMLDQGRGAIMNVGSLDTKLPVPHLTAYAASKGALLSFSEVLHWDLTYKGRGIFVGVVLPGGTRSELVANTDTKFGVWIGDHLTAPPEKVARKIRTAIEKERFETYITFMDRLYTFFAAHFPGLFKKFVYLKVRNDLEE